MNYPILTYSRDCGDFTYDLETLYHKGLRAIRLIYKGKTEQDFKKRIEEVQKKINEHLLNLDIIIDLPGSKPLVGDLENGLDVVSGCDYQLCVPGKESSLTAIPVTGFFNHDSFQTLVAGDIISIADDELNLQMKEVNDNSLLCTALNDFHLKSNRSLSIKNKAFPFQANSERDILFVKNFLSTTGNVKFLVSFAQKADDLAVLKLLQPEMEFIPKIETILSEEVLNEIMKHCTSLMLGRGDLFTASPVSEMFSFQELLINLCKEQNKELWIGTGILANIGDKKAVTIAEVMDYSYLLSQGINSFLIAGSNAHKAPFETLKFMSEFESR